MPLQLQQRRLHSNFPVNMETSRPPHGEPRGLLNKVQSIGLPPWAAWVEHLDKGALYRMSGVEGNGFNAKPDEEIDGIWMDEKIKLRTLASKDNWIYRKTVYPHMMKNMSWYSGLLGHWVQIPHVRKAMYHMEREGGFDNFILNRGGRELRSRYGERIRRHLLVRRAEMRKNFILERHATAVARAMKTDLENAQNPAELKEVMRKWGLNQSFLLRLRDAHEESQEAQRAVEAALEGP